MAQTKTLTDSTRKRHKKEDSASFVQKLKKMLYQPTPFFSREEYCAGKHWILYWIQENKTATYFLRSRLFTYDIMKNFNCY
jgi:hypothetical protein